MGAPPNRHLANARSKDSREINSSLRDIFSQKLDKRLNSAYNDCLMMQDRKRGAKPKLTPAEEEQLIKALQIKDLPVEKIAAMFGLSRSTVYNILKRRQQGEAA